MSCHVMVLMIGNEIISGKREKGMRERVWECGLRRKKGKRVRNRNMMWTKRVRNRTIVEAQILHHVPGFIGMNVLVLFQ